MDIRWLCSLLIIIVAISSTNSQNIINKWKLDDKKHNIDMKNSNSFKKPKSSIIKLQQNDQRPSRDDNLSKQFANMFIDQEKINLKSDEKSSKVHSRKKRLIWVTDDGRLALPPGTVLSIAPTISLPLVRYPYSGFLSNITMSFPLTIDFDKLGLTDNENPLGVVPPIFARSIGQTAGSLLGNYIRRHLNLRSKRSFTDKTSKDETESELPELPNNQKNAFHGGERALLYGAVEDLLTNFGINGKACLLRTICEVHSKSLTDLGLFGEIIKLFFTASKSNFAELMPEYVSAEKIGEGSQSPGECFPYYKDCPKSVFKNIANNRYSESAELLHNYNTENNLNKIVQISNQDELELEESENEVYSNFHM